jgi:hypothetical protein
MQTVCRRKPRLNPGTVLLRDKVHEAESRGTLIFLLELYKLAFCIEFLILQTLCHSETLLAFAKLYSKHHVSYTFLMSPMSHPSLSSLLLVSEESLRRGKVAVAPHLAFISPLVTPVLFREKNPQTLSNMKRRNPKWRKHVFVTVMKRGLVIKWLTRELHVLPRFP